jgi:hypothetical protein
MYRSFAALWEGWTKNLYPLMGGTTRRAFSEFLRVFPAMEIALLSLLWALLRGAYRPPLWLLAVLLLLAILLRWARSGEALYRNLYPISYIKYFVPGMCLYSAALIASWWKSTRGSVRWKGRSYPSGVHPADRKPLPQRTP